jgi:hypothetical protein
MCDTTVCYKSHTCKACKAEYTRLVQEKKLHNLRVAIAYYRKRRDAGQSWTPKKDSKLGAFCISRGLDPVKVVTGEEKIDLSTMSA